MATPIYRPAPRRSRAKAVAQAAVQPVGSPDPRAMAVPAVPLPFPGHASPSVVPFQPRALLAPAKEPQPPAPVSGSPEPVEQAAGAAAGEANPADAAARPIAADSVAMEPTAEAMELAATEAPETDAAALMRELGMEPAPGTPEALALLAEAGVAAHPAPGEPLGPDDERFSPIAIGHLTHRLVEVKRLLEQLTAEQKALHETLRLAHLRGDLLHLLAPSSEGWCYQIGQRVLLNRRQGNKKWSYSELWAELEAQLKARQTYEQATGEATWRHGVAFWEIRSSKG
ncbi:MAG: hypothetical protein ACK6AD_08665 [Cyanobacteriota bacterium]